MPNKAVVTELEVAELIARSGPEIAPQDMNPEEPIFGDSSGLIRLMRWNLPFA
jgi:hypothetical protein